jgi:general secretion pathway protein L
MIPRFLVLWIDGLAAAFVALESLWRRPRRFLLRANLRPFTLYSLGGSAPQLLFTFDNQHPDQVPEKVLEQTRGSLIEIAVPAAAIMQRRLDVLPAESLPYLEQVVQHKVEAMFPWRAADILHATLIDKRADGQLDVSVRATARSAVVQALAVAEACGAGEILIRGEDEDVEHPGAGIPAAIGAEKRSRLARAQLMARYAVFGLLALVVCMVGWTTFANWSLSSDVSTLDDEISNRRAILRRLSEAGDSGQSRGLEARKRTSPIVVVVLDQLSALLPENTYLTDLSLETGHVRITGVSANAAELVPLLEGSGHFKNATFYAPTTRLAGGSTDRFSIEATVVPPSPGGS